MSLPDPLHPAVVHLPLALAMLAPFVVGLAFVVIRRGWLPPRAWVAILLLHGLLAGSAWFAVETGEEQEDRVERVVQERWIEDHEEGAERFLTVAAVALLVSLTGFAGGAAGTVGRGATIAAASVVLAAAIAVGHSGGELVYRHGAADAYVEVTQSPTAARTASHRTHHDD